ncbi:AlpA family phage regulatory protein [Oryzomonas sp.]|uniref:AlpA family phage regulatory protein n=1 Tax=Oryzomonas sp. TaxID=2855186 RepID=UPI0038D4CC61
MNGNRTDRIVRDPEATTITGLGRSQRHRLEKKDEFPKRRKLSPHGRATGYLLSELECWATSRPVLAPTGNTPEIGSGRPGPGRGFKGKMPKAADA